MRIHENHISTTDAEEIHKQAEYYKKMEKIQKSRQEGSLKAQH